MRSINDGRSKTNLYKYWVAMKRRCDNPDKLERLNCLVGLGG